MERLALERITHFLTWYNQLFTSPTHTTFTQLFHHLVAPIQLPLEEHKITTGIHLLDFSTSCTMDFSHVFVVGMNEEVFPKKVTEGSFIPHNLRRGYGLPIPEDYRASLSAYAFYRLLQRAQGIFVTYTTRLLSKGESEMSRYLRQLLYEAPFPIQQHSKEHSVHITTKKSLEIPKTDPLLRRLEQFIVQPNNANTKHISPSVLNTYIDCSLRFCFRYVAHLPSTRLSFLPPSSEISSKRFGTVLHYALERLYKHHIEEKQAPTVDTTDFSLLRQNVQHILQEVNTNAHQENTSGSQGWKKIAQRVLEKLIQRILTLDEAHAPFSIVGLEIGRKKELHIDFPLSNGITVRLGGIIDRVDQKGNIYRILDYKTGAIERRVSSIHALFDSHHPQRNREAMQIIFYAWLFQKRNNLEGKISLGLIGARSIFSTADIRLLLQENNLYTPLEDVTPYQGDIEDCLQRTLTTLWNKDIPFLPTEDATRCMYCPYKTICQR